MNKASKIGNQLTSKLGSWRRFVERHGLLILRLSVGIVFLWFGLLKFFPGSAGENLAVATISWLSSDSLDEQFSLYALAVLECSIGLGILFKKGLTVVVSLMYFQMAGTILPLFIFTDKTWISPFVPSLEGQYIIKNSVLIASGIILGAMARGSKLITHPTIAKAAEKKEKQIIKKTG